MSTVEDQELCMYAIICCPDQLMRLTSMFRRCFRGFMSCTAGACKSQRLMSGNSDESKRGLLHFMPVSPDSENGDPNNSPEVERSGPGA